MSKETLNSAITVPAVLHKLGFSAKWVVQHFHTCSRKTARKEKLFVGQSLSYESCVNCVFDTLLLSPLKTHFFTVICPWWRYTNQSSACGPAAGLSGLQRVVLLGLSLSATLPHPQPLIFQPLFTQGGFLEHTDSNSWPGREIQASEAYENRSPLCR